MRITYLVKITKGKRGKFYEPKSAKKEDLEKFINLIYDFFWI